MFGFRQLIRIIVCLPLLISAILVQGCNKNNSQWQEEIQLSDGNIVWVKRTAHFERTNTGWLSRLGDAASRGRIINMELTIDIPETSFAPKPPIWRFNAVPLLLDYDKEKKTWFIIATYFYCDSWKAAGQPRNEQWQYVVKDGQWIIQALDKEYIGRVTNMYTSFARPEQIVSINKDYIRSNLSKIGDSYKKIKLCKSKC